MAKCLFNCDGGTVILPLAPLIDRAAGGNLVINPPRNVWERSELSPRELTLWSFLVAATGRAMLDVLPQLVGGCINYWEAGNWALNDMADPQGPKRAEKHRVVHMHLLGRSRSITSGPVKWGEAPRFPDYADAGAWTANNQPLSTDECQAVIGRAKHLLEKKYGVPAGNTK